jgi:hypothetical protein
VVKLLGSQVPRIRVVPEGVDHPRWSEVVDFVGRLGIVLDVWQWDVLRSALMRTVDMARWAAFAIAVCAPRQNGKNGVLEPRELVGPYLLGEKLLIHTAHLADTSKEGFRRLEDLLDANAWLSKDVRHIWRTNGHEAIEFTNGNRIRFRTRTRGGGRGFSGSPVFFDEPMFLPEISMGSILPVISAQPDPQVWYTGSAVDQSLHEDGIVFARVRERALKGEDSRLAYFEWSVEADSPDEVEPEVAGDPTVWAATNPALGIRISSEYVKAELGELDPRTFAVERLGVGDWPVTDGSKSSVLDLEVWDALTEIESVTVGQVAFAFDVTPDRSMATIAVSGRRSDGWAHVEVVDHLPGTAWLIPRLSELNRRHSPSAVLASGSAITGSLVHELEMAGVPAVSLNAVDYGKACVSLVDAVAEETVRHLGTKEIRDAIKGAATRPLGDAWAWSRKSSSVDISPLVAATLALWGTATAPSGDYVPDVAALMAS